MEIELREIGPGENGFGNAEYQMDTSQFQEYLAQGVRISKGIDLEPQIEDALLTCDEANIPSRKIIEKHGGKLDKTVNGKCFYRIRQYNG